ncbi:MAG: phosphonate C-P lyase system protein PhnG [Albidovulum sp.]
MSRLTQEQTARQARMGLLARADKALLAKLFPELPRHEWLRAPEVGAVMVQGRTGAAGAPFNLGEMSVTRCALQLSSGSVGHAYVQGRDKAHATRAALIDALMQEPCAAQIEAQILTPLRRAEADQRRCRAEKAAATKVEFFTMVRGED